MNASELMGYVEKPLTVTGRARDASAGATVVADGSEDSVPIYVAGLGTWGDQEGRMVSVRGVLRKRAIIPIATIDQGGSVSHGLGDAVFVIDNPSWDTAP